MNVADVLALIGLLVVMAGALFGVYLNLSSKIDRSYERLDEHKEEFYNNFLLKSVHEESVKHVKELNEQKYQSLDTLVTQKLDNLAKEIKNLSDAINKMNK